MDEPEAQGELTTSRIEFFSDGVFAIAITLLIIEIKVPHLSHEAGDSGFLGAALYNLWSSYFAYFLSFLMIGIYWVNHHYLFGLFKRTNHIFGLLNVFFLMCIAFVPFPTAVLGEYLTDEHNRHTAIVFYALGLTLPAFAWFLIWFYASRNFRLIDKNLNPQFVAYLTRKFLITDLIYFAALLISLWNSILGLVICVGLTLLYLLPSKNPIYTEDILESKSSNQNNEQ